MDPRTALLQQESDDNAKGFRNKSIGMHNLRAKLREQLKGYSHVRGTYILDDICFVSSQRSSSKTFEALNDSREYHQGAFDFGLFCRSADETSDPLSCSLWTARDRR